MLVLMGPFWMPTSLPLYKRLYLGWSWGTQQLWCALVQLLTKQTILQLQVSWNSKTLSKYAREIVYMSVYIYGCDMAECGSCQCLSSTNDCDLCWNSKYDKSNSSVYCFHSTSCTHALIAPSKQAASRLRLRTLTRIGNREPWLLEWLTLHFCESCLYEASAPALMLAVHK